MSVGNPWGLAAAALAAPLVLWYVLRVRRPRLPIASTYLWRRAERTVAAAVPWQRFRGDVTFWLVLAALLLGALALARPYVTVAAPLGEHTILVLDASGSMLADEHGPTRLELARREATSLLGRLGPGQVMSVVEAGDRARVLLSASADPPAIRRALAAVEPTHGPPDLRDAFALVAALQRPGERSVTHLLTDGEVPADAEGAVPDGLLVTAVGSERPNLAVTRVQAVPSGAGRAQVFAQVRNLGTLPAEGALTIRVGGEVAVEQHLRLAPRGTEDVVLTIAGTSGDVLEARVAPTAPGDDPDEADALALDDAAYALLAAPRALDVLVAGPGNVFLEAALAAVPGVSVTSAPTVPDDTDADLLVVDRVAAPAVPDRPTLYVAPSPPPAGATVSGTVELPALTFQAPDHELLTAVDLSSVAIAEAQQVEAPSLTTVAGAPDAPLVLAGRLEGQPVAYVAFDLLQSNLPVQAAWPVLVANTTSWLAGPPAEQPATAGTTVSLPVVDLGDDEQVRVVGPSGADQAVDPVSPRVLVDEVGLWRVRGRDGTVLATVAVNAAPPESDLARPPPAPVEVEGDAGTAAAAEGRRSFTRELLAVVLLLAVGEWLWATVVRPGRVRRRGSRRRQRAEVAA